MKILLSFIFIICNFLIIAQPSIEWQKCYGGGGWDDSNSIQLTNDGGFIIAGSNGVYYLKFTAGDKSVTRKVVKM